MTPTKIVFNHLICYHENCPRDPVNGWAWVAETLEKPDRCGACKSVLWDREPQPRGPKPAKKTKRAKGE